MNVYAAGLAIGAIAVAILNYNQPRALLWILVGATDYALTYRYGMLALEHPGASLFKWLPHAFASGVADAVVAIAIATFGVTRWERMVRYIFIVAISISVAHLCGKIDRVTHATLLDWTNGLALLFIGGAGIIRFVDDLVGSIPWSGSSGRLHRVRSFFDQEKRPEGVVAALFTRA